MSTMTAITNGFTITDASRIIAHLVLSAGKATFQLKFPRAAATGDSNALAASLTRELADASEQFTSISVSATATSPLSPVIGTFTGRDVNWTIRDAGVNRTLAVTVTSPAGATDEVWHLELGVDIPSGGKTNYEVRATALSAISSVDVTP